MTKHLKRTISIVLAALMIVSLFTIVPFSASAAGETPIESIEMLSPNTDFNDIIDTDTYRNYRDLLENHQDVITRIYNGIVNREDYVKGL